MIGKGISAISVSRQSIQNITPSTHTIERRSAIIGTNPSEKISLMDSISLIVRVVNVPIGVLSNCERLSPTIFLYVATLISLTTDWPSKAVVNEKKPHGCFNKYQTHLYKRDINNHILYLM